MREALAGWLGSDDLTIEPLSGGSSNLTFRVRDRGRELVLRRPPMSHVLATANDMKREWTVMSALHDTDVPVPEVVATCTDESVLGAPFYLTEYLDGIVFNDASDVSHLSEQESRACALELMDVLARLHALDPTAVGLAEFGRPAGFLERQLRRWSTQWEKSKQQELPAIDEVARRLAAALPSRQGASIVHGDYSFNNTMFFRSPPTKMQALLDWELSTLGDPLTDVGTVTVYWGQVGELMWASREHGQPHRANAGFPSADVMLERYAEASGRDLSEVDFYKTFAVFKLAVITAGAHARLVATAPDRAQHAGEMTAALAQLALEMAP
jgi:aminoglycoside phosphotransferase (APT) family kinase protein